jgi:hypothetical protein
MTMAGNLAARPTASIVGLDLRRAALADIQGIDFRAATRDFWADEGALWDRLTAAWAGLDDAAWRLSGAAPSDAGGPDWSLLDHVGHLVDWYELAIAYVDDALTGGRWPTDDDYDGGDFDTFNERRRPLFADLSPADLRARLEAAHVRLLAVAARLPLATIYSDAAWGWVYSVLHGHALDHLRVLEPWADRLRLRQVESDPFGSDPQPVASGLHAAQARFWADEAGISAHLDAVLASLPEEAWTATEVTAGWTIADHVGHLTAWFDEAVAALDDHRRIGGWRELPPEGIDAWNERQVQRLRGTPPADLRERYETGRDRLRRTVAEMTDDVWLDPEGFSWAYEDLHGHARCHLAMMGPFAARIGWPRA